MAVSSRAAWPLTAWFLAVLGGAALQLQQPVLWSLVGYAALLALGLLTGALSARCGGRAQAIGVALALAACTFAATGLRAGARLADTLAAPLEGRDLQLTGVVAELPRKLPDGTRFELEVESGALDGRPITLPTRVSLGWYRGFEDEVRLDEPFTALRAGQRWQLPVRLKRIHGTFNPHGFDQELWAFEQGLGAAGTVRATERSPALLLAEGVSHPVERARQRLRDAIEARVPDARAAGVLAALAVGDQAAIERHDWDLFRATGIAHLVSISGLHVTMFAWLAGALVGALWRRSVRAMHWLPAPVAARWGGLAAAAAYALLAGWGVPAQRTVWMIATAVLLTSGGLSWPAPLVLLAAAAVVTLLDPWALLQPGFWLSFVAVGLLFASAPGADEDAAPTRRAALSVGLRSALRTQVVATVGLAPLTLLFFQQISIVGFVANLVAVPLVTLVITPLALLGVLLPSLWSAAAWGVQGLAFVLSQLAALPGAVWMAAAAPPWAQAAALLGGLLAVLPLPWALRALAVPLIVPLLWPSVERPLAGTMQVLVADIGQGSAIVVRTHEHLLVHDAGPQYSRDSDAGTRVLVPLLRGEGWAPIDLLMLSHRDSDHVGGAAALLGALPVRGLSSSLEPGHPLHAGPLPHARCEAGQSWRWDGVEFSVLHPPAADYASPGLKPNAMSCVLRAVDGAGTSLLLTGDLEAEQEARLVATLGPALKSDVLLVPHHGSRTSSSAAFLDAVAPRIALVQAGYRNRYGHPAPDVMSRYRERAITVARSTDCGAWPWRSAEAPGPASCLRATARRYWHHSPPADGAELASR